MILWSKNYTYENVNSQLITAPSKRITDFLNREMRVNVWAPGLQIFFLY